MSKNLASLISAANSLGANPQKNLGTSGANCFARHGILQEVKTMLRLGYSQANIARAIIKTGKVKGLGLSTLQVYVCHVANS